MTTRHDRALRLAATAIDWPLAPDERAELDGHLAECHACVMAAAKLQRQASMLQTRPRAIAPAGMGARIATTWEAGPVMAGFDGALRIAFVALLLLLVLVVVAVGAGAFKPERLATIDTVAPRPAVEVPVPSLTPVALPAIGAPSIHHIPLGSVSGECALIVESGCATDTMVAFGSLWTTSRHGVERVDLVSGESVSTVDVGGDPVRLIATDDSIWATVGGPGTLVRIDPTTDEVVGTVAIGRLPAGLAWFADAIWVAEGESKSIVRVDPTTMAVHSGVDLEVAPWSVAKTADAVWVTDRYAEHLIRIDTGSMTATSIDVPGVDPGTFWDYGDGVVAFGDRLWVAGGGSVARYDPAAATFRTAVTPQYPHLAVTQDALWLSSRMSRILQRLDPDTLEPVAQQTVPVSPITSSAEWEVSIAADDDAIWLQSYEDGLIRIELDGRPGSSPPPGS